MNRFFFSTFLPEADNLPDLLRGWREDTMAFLRHSLPKVVLVMVVAFVLARLLRFVTSKFASLQSHRLHRGISAKQVRTLASVITSIGISIIVFVAALEVLPLFGFELGPLLASAGVAGLAIGFGAQTLVKDFINGFFILLENQYDIGDNIRIAGVKGIVEDMTLRKTVLRDDDGTLHTVPNSNITIVSNTTRDWSKLTMRIVVAYGEPSDKIMGLLREIADEIRHDAAFASDIVSDVELPGIDRVGNGEAEYLMLVKTRPGKQFAITRELRRRIKENFEQNNVKAAGPGRVYVLDQGGAQAS
jgi:moderate conductance mechanosensitive channel